MSAELAKAINKPVVTMADFKLKHGEIGWKYPIIEFISRAPTFMGDQRLAKEIGLMMADLETALQDVEVDYPIV